MGDMRRTVDGNKNGLHIEDKIQEQSTKAPSLRAPSSPKRRWPPSKHEEGRTPFSTFLAPTGGARPAPSHSCSVQQIGVTTRWEDVFGVRGLNNRGWTGSEGTWAASREGTKRACSYTHNGRNGRRPFSEKVVKGDPGLSERVLVRMAILRAAASLRQ